MSRPTSPVVDVRATSTVVDVTVFLLLVSGAVATLVASTGTQPVRSGEPAAETARVLASTTATVPYDPTEVQSGDVGSVEGESVRADGAGFDGTRTAHGTLAALLAEAAVAGARIDGAAVVPAAGPYRRAVADAVRNGTGRSPRRTQVRAVWEPYPDAAVGGSLTVGDAPPADATVHAATLDPDSGVDDVDEGVASTAGERGAGGRGASEPADYRTVANATARAIVERLFPRDATLLALRGDAPADANAARRYERAADALGVDLADGPRSDADVVERRNRRLSAALADRIATDLSDRYETPADAAAAVDADAVEITVRTWSA